MSSARETNEREANGQQIDEQERSGRHPRVCIVMQGFDRYFAGHAIQTRALVPRLEQMDVDAYVVTSGKKGLPAAGEIDGIRIRRLPILNLGSLRMISFALGVFIHLLSNRRAYDIVQVIGVSWHCPAAIFAAKLCGKKSVIDITLMGSDDPERLSTRRFGRLRLALYKQADRAVSLSTAITDACLRVGLSREQVLQIPVGVDIERFRPAGDAATRRRLREQLNLPVEGRLAIYVGSIMPRKRLDLLVDAWPAVLERCPDAYLIVVGPTQRSERDQRFSKEMKGKIAESGTESRILFIGKVDNVPDYLQAADLFVAPSDREGLPNAVLEGLACGLPAVVSDMPGISRDIITREEEGFIVPEQTPSAYASAIADQLLDASLDGGPREAARRRIEEHFTIDHRARRYRDAYCALLE